MLRTKKPGKTKISDSRFELRDYEIKKTMCHPSLKARVSKPL